VCLNTILLMSIILVMIMATILLQWLLQCVLLLYQYNDNAMQIYSMSIINAISNTK